MRFKPDLAKAKERCMAFWENEIIDRAMISVTAPMEQRPRRPREEIDYAKEQEMMRKRWLTPEKIRQNNVDRFSNTFFGGDAMPIIFQNFGTSGHCNYYGANPFFQRTTIWFDPIWDSLDEENIIFQPERLEEHLAITRYLLENAGDDYLVGMPDSCGTIDAIAHMYESTNVLFATMEQPEKLLRAIELVNQGWEKSNEEFYKLFHKAYGGAYHSWMSLWAPGRIAQLQVDLSVMLSPDAFEEFAVPELEQQLEWTDYAVYHFDGAEQERHLDHLLSLDKIKAVQWTDVAGQEPPVHYMHILKRIQEAGKGILVYTDKEHVPALMEELSSKGLYIHTSASTPEEAQELVNYVEKHTKE